MICNQKKDLLHLIEFIRSRGEVTNHDVAEFMRVDRLYAGRVLQILINRGNVVRFGTLRTGKQSRCTVYAFASDSHPEPQPIGKVFVTVSEHIDALGSDDDYEPKYHPKPTSSPRGSLERIAVYRQRVERGEHMFDELDSFDGIARNH